MPLNFRTAIKNMVSNVGDKTVNTDAIFDAVQPICKTDTDGNGGEMTTLYDWLHNGSYSNQEQTARSLAQEWDSE